MSRPYVDPTYNRARFACYLCNVSQAVVSNLSPLLFLTFRDLYDISYSMIGLLILVNFCTQLTVDLLFSFFPHCFPADKCLRILPVLTFSGLVLYAVLPPLFPDVALLPIFAGTVLFSASGGLVEVLLNPFILAIPADDPGHEISILHSVYAWGVVTVVVVSTLFLSIFGHAYWYILALIWSLLPLCAALLLRNAALPTLPNEAPTEKATGHKGNAFIWLCVACIFCGGAAECTMSQWCSGYLEAAVGVPKVVGDIAGMALFAAMLGLGRSLYTKYGRRIYPVLLGGMIGSTACYLLAAVSPVPALGVLACALNGLTASMLWPGLLLFLDERHPNNGISVYALMAAGGDCGAAVAPQIVGLIADAVVLSPAAISLAASLSISAEQIALRAGLFSAAFFPLAGIPILLALKSKKAV